MKIFLNLKQIKMFPFHTKRTNWIFHKKHYNIPFWVINLSVKKVYNKKKSLDFFRLLHTPEKPEAYLECMKSFCFFLCLWTDFFLEKSEFTLLCPHCVSSSSFSRSESIHGWSHQTVQWIKRRCWWLIHQ